MYTAKSVIDNASYVLKDDDNVRWTRAQLLQYVNEAQIAIVQLLPDANTVTKVIDLEEGYKQKLPNDCLVFFSAKCNCTDKGAPICPIRIATRAFFDALMNWYWCPPAPYAENYIYDSRDGKEFQVFPPNDGTGHLEVTYSAMPKPLTEDDELVLGDEFVSAITYFVLYRAALLDSDFNGTGTLAQFYYGQFAQTLGIADTNAEKKGPLPALVPNAPVAPNGGTE